MKKAILFFAALFITGFAFSQSLSLSNNEGNILPGSTVYILGDPSDALIRVELNVTNNTGADLNVLAKKVIAPGDTVAGSDNTFCWGVCFPPFVYESPNPVTILAGQTYPEFDGDYSPDYHPGKSKIMYVFFLEDNRDDSVAVMVEYNASSTGLDDELLSQVTFSRAYPNPANSKVSIDYALPTEISSARVVISNLLGSKVKDVMVSGQNGRLEISVDNLPDGIYFYSLAANDQLLLTRKFVVKH